MVKKYKRSFKRRTYRKKRMNPRKKYTKLTMAKTVFGGSWIQKTIEGEFFMKSTALGISGVNIAAGGNFAVDFMFALCFNGVWMDQY